MNYFVNEYSLRGQFNHITEYFDSLRAYTLPVLNKIEAEEGSVIWKKDSLWSCEVCKDCNLGKIQPHKNERNPALTKLKLSLVKLYRKPVIWSEDEDNLEDSFEYKFDEEYREKFAAQNCFTEACKHEGSILSFEHPVYKTDCLRLTALMNEERCEIELDNIYSIKWWERSPEIKKWMVDKKYLIEIRGKEFEYHPPHFHVSCSGYQAVFELKTGELYTGSGERMPPDFQRDIKRWYDQNKAELEKAWDSLHPPITYNTKL